MSELKKLAINGMIRELEELNTEYQKNVTKTLKEINSFALEKYYNPHILLNSEKAYFCQEFSDINFDILISFSAYINIIKENLKKIIKEEEK